MHLACCQVGGVPQGAGRSAGKQPQNNAKKNDKQTRKTEKRTSVFGCITRGVWPMLLMLLWLVLSSSLSSSLLLLLLLLLLLFELRIIPTAVLLPHNRSDGADHRECPEEDDQT